MEKEPEIIRTSLRLPKALYDKLFEAAESRGVTMHAEILARLDFALSFDDRVNSGPSELAEELSQKLDAQERIMRETREEMSLIKEWLKMGAPDMRGKSATELLDEEEDNGS